MHLTPATWISVNLLLQALQVNHTLDQKTLAPNNEHGSLARILIRAKAHLTDLGKALDHIANACKGSRIKIIAKSAVRAGEKTLFQGFQEHIRPVKATLNTILGAINS